MTWLQLMESIGEMPYSEQNEPVQVFDGDRFLKADNLTDKILSLDGEERRDTFFIDLIP